jgi:hypothetical protein
MCGIRPGGLRDPPWCAEPPRHKLGGGMRLPVPIFGARHKRCARRASWAFNHELDAYARTLARIERRPADLMGDDRSTPMPQRAAGALPRMTRAYAKFREATGELEQTRDAVVRRLEDPAIPADVAASARSRFDQLAARHATPEQIADRRRQWEAMVERLERWAQRDPDHAAATAGRRAATVRSRTSG